MLDFVDFWAKVFGGEKGKEAGEAGARRGAGGSRAAADGADVPVQQGEIMCTRISPRTSGTSPDLAAARSGRLGEKARSQ